MKLFTQIIGVIFLVMSTTMGVKAQVMDTSNRVSASDTTSFLYVDSYDFIYSKTELGEIDTLIGSVRIIQDSLFMTCDRAIVRDQIYARATDNVVIIHHDTIQIFADSLYYDGIRKIAWLYGEVILVEGERTLHTNELIYHVGTKTGYYDNGGTLLEGESRLISKKGSYNAENGIARFKSNVEYSDTSMVLLTDSLDYDYNLSRLYLVSETDIVKDSTHIHCESGIYDINTEDAVLSRNVQIRTGERIIESGMMFYSGNDRLYTFYLDPVLNEGETTARGDTISFQTDSSYLKLINRASYISPDEEVYAQRIEYDDRNDSYITTGSSKVADSERNLVAEKITKDALGSTLASGNVLMEDTAKGLAIWSDYLRFQDSTGVVKAFNSDGRPVMAYELDSDTLYLKADTLVSYSITSGDTLEIDFFLAYGNVQFTKSNMAGVTDSLSFNTKDSIFTLFNNSYIWSDSTQMTADSIFIHMSKQQLSRVELKENALVISPDAGGHFNQISGTYIDNLFKGDQLHKSAVDGNTQLLYFVKDDLNEYVGINSTKASRMQFVFENDEIQEIRYYQNPESELLEYDVGGDFSTLNLPGFNWVIDKKPFIQITSK